MANLKVAENLELPLDTVTSTLVVYGGKGMGKTNFGAVLVEELKKAGQRFAVLDPVGVWHGLQHSADGKRPGIEVLVLGGVRGDLPIEPTAGAVVADLVADEEVDVVIDISRRANGTMWSQGEKIRFIADYCSRLYERQGERRRPLHQVIDEAGRFVPQQIPSGALDIARCVGAIEQLVELGRNVGVGVTLITQRSARMNKSVSELADCMIAFRTVGPRSIDAILDWFGEHVRKERWNALLEQLRALPVGTALVVSPGWLSYEGTAAMRARETFDSSATPKPGAPVRRLTGKAAKPDLETYQQRMASTIERAKADDPKALRARIAELERQAAAKPTAATPPVEVEKIIEVPVIERALVLEVAQAVEGYAGLADNLILQGTRLVDLVEQMRRILSPWRDDIDAHGKAGVIELRPRPAAQAAPREHRRPPPMSPAPRPDNGAKLSGAERKILTVLAQYPGGRAKNQLAVLTGYAVGGGGFGNALSALRTKEMMEGRGDMRATEAGLQALGTWEPLPTGRALLDYWLGQSGKAERMILEALANVYPEALAKQALGDVTGYEPSGGGFGNALSRLRTLELIEGRGELRLTAAFGEAIV